MTGLLWTLAAVLVLIAGVLYLRRLRGLERGDRVTDGMIERIESVGRLEFEEPLDLDEIAREEERFWDETWDEPEEM